MNIDAYQNFREISEVGPQKNKIRQCKIGGTNGLKNYCGPVPSTLEGTKPDAEP